jgi:hypothetical protein
MEYLDTWRRLQAEGAPFPARSASESRAIARFQELLADFKAPGLAERAREVYAAGAWFNDTLKTVRGGEAIGRYLAKTAAALESGTVEFLDVAGSDGDYYLRWQMSLRFTRLDPGKTHRSVGMTHLRFDGEGRVLLHQDFWDSTSGLFEHLPGLGWLLRQAKRRL